MEELQKLLKESSERYGALEDNLEKEKSEHKEELKRRNEAIRTLKKELEDANELISTMRKRGNIQWSQGVFSCWPEIVLQLKYQSCFLSQNIVSYGHLVLIPI